MDHLADPPIPATADLAIEVTAEPADEPPPPRFGTATATMLGVASLRLSRGKRTSALHLIHWCALCRPRSSLSAVQLLQLR